jgi:hypothetical protein
MQNPTMNRIRTSAATATPILAPRERPPLLYLTPRGVAVGVVMFTGVVENSEPWIEIVLPGVGCWIHAAFKAVRTIAEPVLVLFS